MTTLQMLNKIRKKGTLYTINFRNAGIGMTFYEEGLVVDRELDQFGMLKTWRRGLVTYSYYPSFSECVRSNYQRLFGTNRKKP